jgi:prevent-host-death family protein
MRSPHWSLQDAKNSFSAVVAAAQNGIPQTVTKRGKPAAVVLSIAEYQRLSRHESGAASSFVEHLLGMPQDDGTFEFTRVRPRRVDL